MIAALTYSPPAWVHIWVEKPKRFVDGIEILDERILEKHGSFMRVKRWLRGAHPHLGVINPKGWTGVETVVEVDVIKALDTFEVREAPVVEIKYEPEAVPDAAACPALLLS